VTITNSHLNELLDAIRAGGDIDVVRRGMELMLQALVDAEVHPPKSRPSDLSGPAPGPQTGDPTAQ
jgi:hypothetical protein